MTLFTTPTLEQTNHIFSVASIDFGLSSSNPILYKSMCEDTMLRLHFNSRLSIWHSHIVRRCAYARWSWTMIKHLKNLGIPDEVQWINYNDGIKIMPNIRSKDESILFNQFQYFSSDFFYRIGTILETFGHIINDSLIFEKEDRKVSFDKSVSKLKNNHNSLCLELKLLTENEYYEKYKKIRNSDTHREQSGLLSGNTKYFEENSCIGISFGIGNYLDSSYQIKVADEIYSVLNKISQSIIKYKISIDKEFDNTI